MAKRALPFVVLAAFILAGTFERWDTSAVAVEPAAKVSSPEYWLGVICHPLKKGDRARLDLKGGLTVEEVVPDSPADKAGIMEGDILIKVADLDLRRVKDLVEFIAESREKKISLLIIRDGEEISLRVSLEKRPAVIDFAKAQMPPKAVDTDDDAAKEKQLMEAAKAAIARLESAKAQDDAEKNENLDKPHHAKPVENLSIAVGKLSDGPAIGTVRQAGAIWRVTPKSAEALPEGVREHVQMSFLRIEADANEPKPFNAAEPVKQLTNEIQQLEKRVNEIDRKLDEVLKLLKAEPARPGKKNK